MVRERILVVAWGDRSGRDYQGTSESFWWSNGYVHFMDFRDGWWISINIFRNLSNCAL